eukprot:85956-Pyramimonas_sp.AAC.1
MVGGRVALRNVPAMRCVLVVLLGALLNQRHVPVLDGVVRPARSTQGGAAEWGEHRVGIWFNRAAAAERGRDRRRVPKWKAVSSGDARNFPPSWFTEFSHQCCSPH